MLEKNLPDYITTKEALTKVTKSTCDRPINYLKNKVRAKKFAKAYVESGGNQTTAMLAVNPFLTKAGAQVQSSRAIRKPYIRQEIMNLFDKENLELERVIKVHKRNLMQTKQLGVSQTAVNDYYNMVGLRGREEENPTNIAIIINTGGNED